jgi:ribosome-binding factor A
MGDTASWTSGAEESAEAMAANRRKERVAEALRAELAASLQSEVADARLASLVVTRVDVAPDLGSARIFVRLLSGDEDPAERKAALRSLHRASSRLKRALAPRLGLRRFPELRFEYDSGHDAARRVQALLDEIDGERPSQPPD